MKEYILYIGFAFKINDDKTMYSRIAEYYLQNPPQSFIDEFYRDAEFTVYGDNGIPYTAKYTTPEELIEWFNENQTNNLILRRFVRNAVSDATTIYETVCAIREA